MRDHYSQGDTDGLMSLLFAGLAFDLHCSVSRSQCVRTRNNPSSNFGSGRNSPGWNSHATWLGNHASWRSSPFSPQHESTQWIKGQNPHDLLNVFEKVLFIKLKGRSIVASCSKIYQGLGSKNFKQWFRLTAETKQLPILKIPS